MTEWTCIKRDYEEIDELPLDDELKADLFQRIYTYIGVAGSFLRVHGYDLSSLPPVLPALNMGEKEAE